MTDFMNDLTPPPGCPAHQPSQRRATPSADRPAGTITRTPEGHYRVSGYEEARAVLRSNDVRQAGFMAESVRDVPMLGRPPVLFAEGEHHHEMRRSTARYFTPKAVAEYHPMMARLADQLIARLAADGEANVDDLSLKMAVGVAAQVVGLTGPVPGLEGRVMAFVNGSGDSTPGAAQRQAAQSQAAQSQAAQSQAAQSQAIQSQAIQSQAIQSQAIQSQAIQLRGRLQALLSQQQVLSFLLLDVKPAIAARRQRRRDDLISHLLDRGYSDLEILTECVTYGTAGMVTTREFISLAAWHLLSDEALKNEYLHAPEAERHATLLELLRLEPVVSQLFRRTEAALSLGGTEIPAGSVVQLDVVDIGSDPALLGDTGQQVCPLRELPRGVQPQLMAFGDGHHRCPGAFLAIHESDTLLRRLLMLDLRVVTPPTVTFNETVRGYELRGFRVALG